ncbi:UDP-glucose 4-epimerase [Lysobacter niabensis]|uniref:UDP-glucose 4-epimerase n=1 Tax=Agrilutibacter niabensis TaxID=380628 RepID=A0ABU1VME2_9GAMM|nr:UDP-glucose 4-epimerase GalE [Lysobacter niabensis]MDR7098308.1 UDP-glucose 4-epimerase [Lysobacter niabensis]
MKILVCGGAGYIGSHTCVALAQRGHEVVIYDSLVNSSPIVVERIRELAGQPVAFHQGDIRDTAHLQSVLADGFHAVIHFAALKAVGESCEQPLAYFENNISGTISLLKAMATTGVHHLVFSSSATVYGSPDAVPITEDASLRVTNPYGRTKLVMEDLIRDLCVADPRFNAMLLRYFNPVGAHPSGRLGEDPAGIPNNLMPYISQVAIGRRAKLSVFGGNYPTPDGTGVRDYIHVMDLAEAHVHAVERLRPGQGCQALNLGTGRGVSVLELVRAFEWASGRTVPYAIVDRRPGDVAECWADPSRAAEVLGWRAQYDVRRMCEDAWRWQTANPDGYC